MHNATTTTVSDTLKHAHLIFETVSNPLLSPALAEDRPDDFVGGIEALLHTVNWATNIPMAAFSDDEIQFVTDVCDWLQTLMAESNRPDSQDFS